MVLYGIKLFLLLHMMNMVVSMIMFLPLKMEFQIQTERKIKMALTLLDLEFVFLWYWFPLGLKSMLSLMNLLQNKNLLKHHNLNIVQLSPQYLRFLGLMNISQKEQNGQLLLMTFSYKEKNLEQIAQQSYLMYLLQLKKI